MRTSVAVVVGYMTMVIVVMSCKFAAFRIQGVEWALEPGSYIPTGQWIALSFGFGFGAAILGGYVCAVISRDTGGPNLLAAAVLALGLVTAGFTLWKLVDEPLPVRPPTVEISEAMTRAVKPAWVAFVDPFVGIAGILLGCRLRRRAPA